MDLRETRIRRLQLFAQRHGAEDNPSKLGNLIGKKPNQVYNLLNRHASFGEKVARSIEQAAGLPKYWLDAEDAAPVASVYTPEADQIARQIDELPKAQRDWVLMTVRTAIDLAREMTANVTIPGHKQIANGELSHSAKRRNDR